MKLLVHASGYLTVPPFRSDIEEIRCQVPAACGGTPSRHWSPSSRDFAAAGTGSGGSSPAATINELIALIKSQTVESIEELRMLAHANDQMFCLSGEVRNDDVYFTKSDGWIGPSTEFKAAIPQFHELQDRFTAGATITLLGCNSGSGKEAILDIVSHAFLRKATGCKDEIKYNFAWAPAGPRSGDCPKTVRPDSRITVRARMLYAPGTAALGTTFGEESLLGLYVTNAWKIEPDVSSNIGDIFIPMRRKDVGAAAVELIGRIINEFFPAHAWVSGYGYEEKLPGLQVRKGEGTHIFIDAGRDFVSKATPANLKSRVAAMGKALDLVKAGSAGMVPLP